MTESFSGLGAAMWVTDAMGSPTLSMEHCSDFISPTLCNLEVPGLKKISKDLDLENAKNDIVLIINSINILFSKQLVSYGIFVVHEA